MSVWGEFRQKELSDTYWSKHIEIEPNSLMAKCMTDSIVDRIEKILSGDIWASLQTPVTVNRYHDARL